MAEIIIIYYWPNIDLQAAIQLINLHWAPYELVKTLLELMTDVTREGSGEHVCLHILVRVSLTNKV